MKLNTVTGRGLLTTNVASGMPAKDFLPDNFRLSSIDSHAAVEAILGDFLKKTSF